MKSVFKALTKISFVLVVLAALVFSGASRASGDDHAAAGGDSGEVKRSPRGMLGPCTWFPRAAPHRVARARPTARWKAPCATPRSSMRWACSVRWPVAGRRSSSPSFPKVAIQVRRRCKTLHYLALQLTVGHRMAKDSNLTARVEEMPGNHLRQGTFTCTRSHRSHRNHRFGRDELSLTGSQQGEAGARRLGNAGSMHHVHMRDVAVCQEDEVDVKVGDELSVTLKPAESAGD